MFTSGIRLHWTRTCRTRDSKLDILESKKKYWNTFVDTLRDGHLLDLAERITGDFDLLKLGLKVLKIEDFTVQAAVRDRRGIQEAAYYVLRSWAGKSGGLSRPVGRFARGEVEPPGWWSSALGRGNKLNNKRQRQTRRNGKTYSCSGGWSVRRRWVFRLQNNIEFVPVCNATKHFLEINNQTLWNPTPSPSFLDLNTSMQVVLLDVFSEMNCQCQPIFNKNQREIYRNLKFFQISAASRSWPGHPWLSSHSVKPRRTGWRVPVGRHLLTSGRFTRTWRWPRRIENLTECANRHCTASWAFLTLMFWT